MTRLLTKRTTHAPTGSSHRWERLFEIDKNATYVADHRYIAGLSDYGLHVAAAFRSEEGHDPVADHVDHRAGGFDGLSPRVAPSQHQVHVRQDVGILVDLCNNARVIIAGRYRLQFL